MPATMTAPADELFLDVKQVAKRWKVTTRTVYAEVSRGKLRKLHMGRRVRFAVDEVRRYEREA